MPEGDAGPERAEFAASILERHTLRSNPGTGWQASVDPARDAPGTANLETGKTMAPSMTHVNGRWDLAAGTCPMPVPRGLLAPGLPVGAGIRVLAAAGLLARRASSFSDYVPFPGREVR